jgi:hypothetical protein
MTATIRVNETDAVIDALRGLLPSAMPALVFTSLAALCVPTFSDRCLILIEEDGVGTYLIERPLIDTPDIGARPDNPHRVLDSWSGQWVSDHMVQTPFDQTRTGATAGYRGSVLHLWHNDYHPTGTDVALAQLAVDHAVSVLEREQDRMRSDRRPRSVVGETRHGTATDPVRAGSDADRMLRSIRHPGAVWTAGQWSHHAG